MLTPISELKSKYNIENLTSLFTALNKKLNYIVNYLYKIRNKLLNWITYLKLYSSFNL